MEKFVDFMTGMYGRALRIVAGSVLVFVALQYVTGVWMWVLLAVAALLVVSGAIGVCGFNLLVGRKINACLSRKG